MIENNHNLNQITKDSEIVRDFDAEKWLLWLDDILNFGIAYPYSRLSTEGDVVVENVNYLRTNSIPTYAYEEAVVIAIHQNSNNFSAPAHLERLIDALIVIKGIKSTRVLIKLLKNRAITHLKGEKDFIITKALLAIARLATLPDDLKTEVENHVKMQGLNDMINDPSYAANFLRFSYLHFDNRKFFNNLTVILFKANNYAEELNNATLRRRYLNVLTDKISELHYRSITTFYSDFLNWFIADYKLFEKNLLFNEIITVISGSLHDPDELGDFLLLESPFGIQEHYGLLLLFLTSLFARSPTVVSHDKIIRSFAYLYQEDSPVMANLDALMAERADVLLRYYRSIPFEVNSVIAHERYSARINHRIIELFDEVLNTPTIDEQHFDKATVKTIFANTNYRNTNQSKFLAEELSREISEAIDAVC